MRRPCPGLQRNHACTLGGAHTTNAWAGMAIGARWRRDEKKRCSSAKVQCAYPADLRVLSHRPLTMLSIHRLGHIKPRPGLGVTRSRQERRHPVRETGLELFTALQGRRGSFPLRSPGRWRRARFRASFHRPRPSRRCRLRDLLQPWPRQPEWTAPTAWFSRVVQQDRHASRRPACTGQGPGTFVISAPSPSPAAQVSHFRPVHRPGSPPPRAMHLISKDEAFKAHRAVQTACRGFPSTWVLVVITRPGRFRLAYGPSLTPPLRVVKAWTRPFPARLSA